MVFGNGCGNANPKLIAMYRQTGAGKVPVAPARLALLTLLQRYADVADHDALYQAG